MMIDKTVGESLEEFHEAYGKGWDLPGVDLLILRRKLIKEEYEEVMAELDKLIMLEATYEQALGEAPEDGHLLLYAKIEETNKKLLKELCDLTYVSAGCAHVLDMNFDGAFAAVHKSNMSKLGEDGKPIYREDGKVLKGPNYKPAKMDAYV